MRAGSRVIQPRASAAGALASGTPVPAIYLLADEPGINAFAAGFSPSDAVIGVTLDSVFNLCRHAVDGMQARGFGRIVNISSVSGQTGNFGQVNYAAAKAGLHGFSMSLAREVARKGVTVNSVSPGYVETPMTRAMPDEVRERTVASVPVGRIGQPADIARAVAFLTADDAGYITGANVPVNGGLFMSF